MSALTAVSKNHNARSMLAMVSALIPSISWRHHGIGVLQGYVLEHSEPEIRIHVWHPSLMKRGMYESGGIHDHRFDLTSHVLLGNIIHEEWLTIPNETGLYTTTELTHARAAAESKFHGPIRPTNERFDVRSNSMLIEAGFTYQFPSTKFHRTLVNGITITVVEKYRQKSIPARLLHRVDLPPVMAFGHDIDAKLLRAVLTDAKNSIAEYLEVIS